MKTKASRTSGRYTKIILGTSVLAPVAQGAIVYSGLQNVFISGGEGGEGPLNLGFSDQTLPDSEYIDPYNGEPILIPGARGTTIVGTGFSDPDSPDDVLTGARLDSNVGGRFIGDQTTYAYEYNGMNYDYTVTNIRLLPGGYEIGPLSPDFVAPDPSVYPDGGSEIVSEAAFAPEGNRGQTAFLGLEFPQNGQTHYGWVQVSTAADGSGLTVIDWAFEDTPNQAITAGAIPEPSSLALLASGGLLAFRRKRSAQN